MSRKTKKVKQPGYAVVGTQVVRMDTVLANPKKYSEAQGFKHAETVHPEQDLDFTVAHRRELQELEEKATANAKAAGLVK